MANLNCFRICAAILTLILGLAYFVLDIVIVLYHLCYISIDVTAEGLSNFDAFYFQYLSGDSCTFTFINETIPVERVYYQCIDKEVIDNTTNVHEFNSPDSVFLWIIVHLVLAFLWSGFSIFAFWDRLKFGWQVTTFAFLLLSLAAAIVFAIDIETALSLSDCLESNNEIYTKSLISSLILPLYFSQGGFVIWLLILVLWIAVLVMSKKAAPNPQPNRKRRLERSLSDAPSELVLNRISKRYKDPAKAYSNQSPVTKRNGHTVQQAPVASTSTAAAAAAQNHHHHHQQQQQQPQIENKNDERRLSDGWIMFPTKKPYDNHGYRSTETELPLSAANLSRRLPEESNPVHRVFVTKKPSLRRDSVDNGMKSFAAPPTRPTYPVNSPNVAGFSSDSDVGSPVNRRYGSYPSPPLSQVSTTLPSRVVSPAPTYHSNSGSYRPQSSIPPIPKADYSPSGGRPKPTTRTFEDVVPRKDKVPRKAIRTPSGRSFTATEYLKNYTPGQAPLKEEDDGVVRYLIQLKR